MGAALAVLIIKWRQLWTLPPAATPFKRSALALVAIAVATTPFSIWPGASVQFLYQQLPVLLAAVIVACKVCSSWRVLARIIRGLIIAALVLALTAIRSFHGGRAESAASYDPNDLAYMLVSVMPLALGFVLTSTTRMKRLVNGGVFAVVVLATLLTGSRGGFLGLLAVLACLVLLPIKRPTGGKARRRIIPSLLGLLCVGCVVWPYLPAETRERLASIVQLGTDYNSDTSNLNGRASIWQRSFNSALQRPVGYGSNSFAMVDLRTGGRFRAPHNSYLEALVELGFLGLFLFVRMYVLSWRALQRSRRSLLAAAASRERDAQLVFARMLQAALAGNAVAGFFLSMAYSTLLWTLFALVIAMVSLVAAGAPAPALPRAIRSDDG
ncbi:MAG TPA: O-antigen ligase family protein [Steroidobacteraceae bacterium]|nr:O-antigen ligase family protein [Steroidobacteraceae bacterium]